MTTIPLECKKCKKSIQFDLEDCMVIDPKNPPIKAIETCPRCTQSGGYSDFEFIYDNNVYVGTTEYNYGRMIMSHMGSPDLEALHRMADAIGVKRKWFQDKRHHPHYDISKQMKKKAIELGAVEVSDKELIRKCYPVLSEFMDRDKK